MKNERPFFLIVRGLPGSGKSTLAEYLEKGTTAERFLRLDPDQVKVEDLNPLELLRKPEEKIPEQTLKYRFLLKQAQEALSQGKNVIWDQPWRSIWGIRVTHEKLFAALDGNQEVEECCFELIVIELLLDEKLAKQRLEQRLADGKHGPSPNTFERFVAEFEPANPQEFLVFQVDAEQEPAKMARQVEQFLKSCSPKTCLVIILTLKYKECISIWCGIFPQNSTSREFIWAAALTRLSCQKKKGVLKKRSLDLI